MDDTKEQLEKSIKYAAYQLKQFTDDKLISATVSQAYNRLLIKKAVMVKELEELDKNKFIEGCKKLTRKLTNKKRICDNF